MDFLEHAEKDARLGPLHISLYMAIFYRWIQRGGKGPVQASAKELMPLAKIGGSTPMYRTLRDLHAFGYIEYQPSYNPQQKSKLYLPML